MITEEKIKELIQAQAQENKITCAQLHEIGEIPRVSLEKLGEITDSLKVKIIRCQLGCF